jgi:hypothetical protein
MLKTAFDYNDFLGMDEEWLTYEGQLRQDKKHGWGIMILSNGERFEG